MKYTLLLISILIYSIGYGQVAGTTTADFTTPSFNICVNDCINFNDASVGTNISAWNWTFNGATTPTSTDQNPTNICYPTAGTYDVTLAITDDNGTDNVTYQIMVSTCTGGPTAAFAVDTMVVCKGDCISFTDLSTGDPTSWSWSFQGARSEEHTSSSHVRISYAVFCLKKKSGESFNLYWAAVDVQVQL